MGVIGLTAEEERIIADSVWRSLVSGQDEEEVRNELGLDHESFALIRQLAFDRATETIRQQPQEYVYADYLVRQSKCIRELSEMVGAWRHRDEDGRIRISQPGAYVSAVRTKSEILDRILETGRQLGMVKVTEGGMTAGINLKDMSNKEIQGQIVREVKNLDRLVKKFGDADIVDTEPGEMYLDGKPRSAVFGGAS